ncbi:uncharacterized protein LOC114789243 isoform X2 [Denticeps clupeoides]|nr:uncharacterized protein LOC114789243 isoform X2 [Denticeps clupeoides]
MKALTTLVLSLVLSLCMDGLCSFVTQSNSNSTTTPGPSRTFTNTNGPNGTEVSSQKIPFSELPTNEMTASTQTNQNLTTSSRHATTHGNADKKMTSGQRAVLFICIVFILIVMAACYIWMTRRSRHGEEGSLRNWFQDQLGRLRVAVTTLGGLLGCHLWPQQTPTESKEDGEMSEKNMEAENAKRDSKLTEEDDQREEMYDSSDDYSSLEGVDLRERARQNRELEEEDKSIKEERKKEKGDAELVSVTLEGGKSDDLTVI